MATRTITLNNTPSEVNEMLATKIARTLLVNNRQAIKTFKQNGNGGFTVTELEGKRLFQYINDQLGCRFIYQSVIQLLVLQNLPTNA